ncbi:ribonucleoside-triphosphate reductase [Thermobifida phage P318]|nr:ribonucleoside-triphosphate reductase [Thermobifida phage P318]
MNNIPWGPSGQLVYERTYSRTKPDGTKETWPETVRRVVDGNLALVPNNRHISRERERLIELIENFGILPAGRHLWASGVKGREHLFNCVSGDTPVHTEDGVFPIRELAGKTVKVLSEGGVYREAKFRSFGVQELMRVKLSNGEEFLATPDHEWVVVSNDGKNRRKKTHELKPRYRIPLNLVSRPEEDEDYFEGIANGIVYGDGSIDGPSSRITLCGEKEELAKYLLPYSANDSASRNSQGLHVGRMPKRFKELPPLTASPSYWRGFINGLVATDGNVRNGNVRLYSSKLDHLKIIALGAARAGIAAREPIMNREYSPFNGKYSPEWAMTLKGGCFEQADFLRSKHKGKKIGRVPKAISVVSVEPTNRYEEVFCCTEMETHTMTIGRGVLTGQCWHSGWDDNPSSHFTFSFLRLMEGGGVGANYATEKVSKYGKPKHPVSVHIVMDEDHPDYKKLKDAGVLADKEYLSALAGYCPHEVGDSREGWANALADLIETAFHPDDEGAYERIIFDVSRVRPEGAPLKKFGGTASGPLPLARMLIDTAEVLNRCHQEGRPLTPLDAMDIDHAVAQCVVSGGVRRSARMSILPWDDPHIHDFIACKRDTSSHWTTNISVAVDDNFFDRLNENDPKAKAILEEICAGMLANGEPGIWNHSYSQEGELGVVDSTNPCGEIPLEEWEACNLGHINLDYFAPKRKGESFRLEEAKEAAHLMARFLLRATFGGINDARSRNIMDKNRRIGVGITGVQGMLAKLGIRFSEAWKSEEFINILRELRDEVYRAVAIYAFELRVPVPVKTTTVAPTGTISKLPGVTEGIHPIYARYFIRRIRLSTLRPEEREMIDDYKSRGFKVEPDLYAANTMVVEIPTKEKLVDEVTALGYPESIVESADEIDLQDLLALQAVVQEVWADNAISMTANINATEYSVENLANTITEYGPLVKGMTIMPRGDVRPQAPYEAISKEEYEEASVKQVSDSIDESCATGACPIK